VREVGAGGKALRSILRAPRALNGLIETLEKIMPSGKFRAMLVLVFEGAAEATAAGVIAARAIAKKGKGEDLGEGPAQRWLEHRYAVSYRQPPTIRTGAFLDTMEVAAPWSRLGALFHDVRKALGKHVFVMAHLSHAYPDGCSIYFTFAGVAGNVGDGGDPARTRYDEAWRDALDAAIGAGGTLSHHHGVGRSKAPKLGAELGVGVDVNRMLKAAFDPRGILNPGNLMPEGTARHPGAPESSLPKSIEIDTASLLVRAPASATMASLEAAANGIGATLGMDTLEGTLGGWLDAGCPGSVDRYDDPVDHAFAGLDARLKDGRILSVRACPRRAVGPDLTALVSGARGRFMTPLAASVRVYPKGVVRPKAPVGIERDPAVGADEERVLAAIEQAIR
jgi:alkyldihydroxyacetonephosphate synthase